jgi:hypothetical protein
MDFEGLFIRVGMALNVEPIYCGAQCYGNIEPNIISIKFKIVFLRR